MINEATEQIDELNLCGYRLIQPKAGFRFTLDPVLLGLLAFLPNRCKALDLGTGTGIIPHVLVARGAETVLGIEINPVMAQMASRSVAMNGLTEKITIQQGDLKEIRQFAAAGYYDLVVANPPYLPVGQGKISPNPLVAEACHEQSATLADFVQAARFAVKYRGRVAFVYRTERLAEMIHELRVAQIEPKRLRLIHSRAGEKPYLFFVEGVRGAQPGLEVLPPFVVYDEQGKYTAEIKQFYACPRRPL